MPAMDAPGPYKLPTNPQEVNRVYARVDEVAFTLNISNAMVRKMISSGKIPVVRFGKALRIPVNWLEKQAEGRTA